MSTPSDADQPGGLPAFPTASSVDETAPTSVVRPRTVTIAFWLLIASAALHLASAVITLASYQALYDHGMATKVSGMSPAQQSDLLHNELNGMVMQGFVIGALFVVLAIMIRAGRNWARLTATVVTVLFALYVLLLAGGALITLVAILLTLAAIAVLFSGKSKDYFQAMKATNRVR